MIKDLKQRLGFVHYQVRIVQVIQRHMALSLLSYGVLILLKIIQWLRDKTLSLWIPPFVFQPSRNEDISW